MRRGSNYRQLSPPRSAIISPHAELFRQTTADEKDDFEEELSTAAFIARYYSLCDLFHYSENCEKNVTRLVARPKAKGFRGKAGIDKSFLPPQLRLPRGGVWGGVVAAEGRRGA